ncbi:minor structural protein VP2 [Tulane virus]|uniref:Minor structural protein VP2 n=1 Tax=Tulane virus TaxID=512169 RepID=B2Y6D1_9CALI|nr:minor structural protein VP2 [Tulane virus]ACB38133.1 minor structural protein VP2 [Tulane virus]
MAGAAFASGLGQAAGGIFGSLISGAIQAGLNEQQFNHNKALAEQQFGYNLQLAQQNATLTKDINQFNQQLELSKYTNAGFSLADAALMSKSLSSGLSPTRVLTSAGVKVYASGAPTSYLTSGKQISSGIQTMHSALSAKPSKTPTVYKWVNNPLNYDTLSIGSEVSSTVPTLSRSSSVSSKTPTLSRSSSISSISSGSLSRFSTWGSYMDYKMPLNKP